MKKTFKVSEVLATYRIINLAKYTLLANADKMKFLRITLAMKAVSDKFEEDTKTVADKIKKSDFKDYDEHQQKAFEYKKLLESNGDMSKAPMGAAEYKKFMEEEFHPFNTLVNDTMQPYADENVDLEIDTLDDDAFGNLMSSNDWTMAQVVFLQEMLCAVSKKKEAKKKK